MSRLRLIIADTDEYYSSSLLEFITLNYPDRLQADTFTTPAALNSFIFENITALDILLLSPELFCMQIPTDKFKAVIILSDGKLTKETLNFNQIYKYQSGDKLVSSILSIYAEKTSDEVITAQGSGLSKLIAVYSPSGGSGKTTLSAGMCINYSCSGFKVFYLNLENYPSTDHFFLSDNGPGISHMLYHLKDKSRNLGLRFEGIRCIDNISRVHFFSPPESVREIEEINAYELKQLLSLLKQNKQYDIIMIDMSSSLNSLNMEILKECDRILLVIPDEHISDLRTQMFIKELGIIEQKNCTPFSEKITLVFNKCNSGWCRQIEKIKDYGIKSIINIPKFEELNTMEPRDLMHDSSSRVSTCLSQISDQLIADVTNES